MTGAEALQKILDAVEELKTTVDGLKSSIQIIEAQIKVLNNRAAGLMRDTAPSYPSPSRPSSLPAVSAGVPAPKQQQPMKAAPARGRQLAEAPEEQRDEARNFIKEASDSKGVLTYKKVFGRLVNNDNDPIESVLIKVYNRHNEVCASTETDPIGYWEIMLTPGRYVAEYLKTGFKTTNKTFDVGKNAKEFEVK